MNHASLKRKLTQLESTLKQRHRHDNDTLQAIQTDPTTLMTRAGMTPDAWQEQVLRSTQKRTILLCVRKRGKSSVAAAVALKGRLTVTRSPVLLISPTIRQSGEKSVPQTVQR